MRSTTGWAVFNPGSPLTLWPFVRRDLRDDDVAVQIRYCGVCSSDLHAVRHGNPNDMPLVTGHEMTGNVTAVGSNVTGLNVGDVVAIGNVVDSCGACPACTAGRENWCFEYPTITYGGRDRNDNTWTQGGFSGEYVARERFVHALPQGLDPASAAPLLCAGVTVYAPLRRWGASPGMTIGIVGIGGLGHLAIKYAHALGAHVVAFTTSPGKAREARRLGADEAIVSTDRTAMASTDWGFDLILDTVGVPHSLDPFLRALKLDGTLVTVGAPDGDWQVNPSSLRYGEKRLTGSGGDGMRMVSEMLDFSAEHSITADIELLPVTEINTALDRLERGDVRYRFVVDVAR